MNQPKFFRLGNRVINLSAIADVFFREADDASADRCEIRFQCECLILVGDDAKQFWSLMRACSPDISSEKTNEPEAIAAS